MISEAEVLSKIRNRDLIAFYEDLPKITGLRVRFEALVDDNVRARSRYKNNSTQFVILLGDNWKEVDLAHELIHGKIMFIDKYGIIKCNNDLCQLIREYIEDIIVHENILSQLGIMPIHQVDFLHIMKLAKGLFRGEKIIDSHWDSKGLICNQLHKALLYVQAWHFYHLLNDAEFKKFLLAFRKTHGQNREMQLADEIIEIYKSNNNFRDKVSYGKALEEIMRIDYLNLSLETSIKYYKRSNGGFVLT